MMLYSLQNVSDVRETFRQLLADEEFVIDKTGCKMLEIVGATFKADEQAIFGEPNLDYIEREIKWYHSMSLNVNDIPNGAPKAWRECATPDGRINSNYGWMIWSPENYTQYNNVVSELKKNPFSRRAVMIYTRPSMWREYDKDGMSDFVCTNAVQYLIRNDKLHAVVQMRSNDALWGYKNDRAFQLYVLWRLAAELCLPPGDLIWHAGSLHVYQRHFDLVNA